MLVFIYNFFIFLSKELNNKIYNLLYSHPFNKNFVYVPGRRRVIIVI